MVETNSESSLRSENITNAVSDFSPGIMIVLAQRKRKKEKGEREKVERDHKAASDFSPGIFYRFSTAEELKVKSKK